MPGLDLEGISRSVVKLRADVPEDAFTAGILGSQRTGNGVVIDSNGLILTIGYLVTEATDVWLTTPDGRELAGHPLAYDQVTGFGLVLPLEKADIAPIPLGSSAELRVGDRAFAVSSPEFAEPQPVHIFARREFAGAWEYLLDDAIFATPAHPHWSGSALIDHRGRLAGVGSLLVRELTEGEEINANMFVPIDLLKPILEELTTRGRASRQSRPWLGVYAAEMTGKIYVTGVAEGGPAHLAGHSRRGLDHARGGTRRRHPARLLPAPVGRRAGGHRRAADRGSRRYAPAFERALGRPRGPAQAAASALIPLPA